MGTDNRFSKRLIYTYSDDFYREYMDNSFTLIDTIISKSSVAFNNAMADLRRPTD
jgi:hypothetical protein